MTNGVFAVKNRHLRAYSVGFSYVTHGILDVNAGPTPVFAVRDPSLVENDLETSIIVYSHPFSPQNKRFSQRNDHFR